MFIRNFDYMEKGMSITYEDIRRKRMDLQNKYDTRKANLHKSGYELVDQYKKSLALESDRWVDSDGRERAYVTVGFINTQGNFERRPISGMDLDDNYHLGFLISTVVDDRPLAGGDHYLITISMWYESGMLKVDIGNGKHCVIVAAPEEQGGFVEVCSAIKKLIISGFTEPRLE